MTSIESKAVATAIIRDAGFQTATAMLDADGFLWIDGTDYNEVEAVAAFFGSQGAREVKRFEDSDLGLNIRLALP